MPRRFEVAVEGSEVDVAGVLDAGHGQRAVVRGGQQAESTVQRPGLRHAGQAAVTGDARGQPFGQDVVKLAVGGAAAG